jgi:hypothetical protein
MDIIKKENIIEESYLEMLCHHMTSLNFPWFLLPLTGEYQQPEKSYDRTDRMFSFAHTLVMNGNINSEEVWKFDKLIHKLYTAFDIQHQNTYIQRIRIGNITCVGESIEHGIHIDYAEPHRTLLFYFNDSSGSTRFYSKDKDDRNVSLEVLPKANTAYDFDGLIYHSSSSPDKNNHRFVLNINYATKK